MGKHKSGRSTHRQARNIVAPPPPPPPAIDSSQSSRAMSPLVPQQQPYNNKYMYQTRRILHNALALATPLGIGYAIGKWGKPIYKTIKDVANYGKRMTLNTLAAIRSTPFYEDVSSDDEPINPNAISPPKPTPTAIPKPTQDPQHPRTS